MTVHRRRLSRRELLKRGALGATGLTPRRPARLRSRIR